MLTAAGSAGRTREFAPEISDLAMAGLMHLPVHRRNAVHGARKALTRMRFGIFPDALSAWWLLSTLAFVILVVLAWLGTRVIDEEHSGLVIKRFGPPLPEGRIIATHGEAGYQARMLPPGWHVGWWRWRY